eukprot:maker-scaffold5040_size5084-snap-gene-0.0 protein:Tk02286 transcript:maker-scaffold5040_size5084-snap-gene-0.0-mRNA-1 annotation:"heat shock protein hsp70"
MAKISINLTSGKVSKNKAVIGIDLGTTNSLIASINKENRKPFCISNHGDSIVPSAILFDQEKVLVGKRAIQQIIAQPENTIYSVKRLMGKSYSDLRESGHELNYTIIDDEKQAIVKVKVAEKLYSPIELSSYILKELKAVAEERLGEEVSQVVITVPAYFNDSQRQATRDAGKLAGMDVLRIINEPTAASLAYGLGSSSEKPKTVAVYDLGGGTFDISILNIENGIYEVLSTNGDTYLGGDDIDKVIVEHWSQEIEYDRLDKKERQSLRITAENAKKHLSTDTSFTTELSLAGKKHKLMLTVMQLNELIKPLLDTTMECSLKALTDAELTAEDIDEVVLVGGSTKTPSVKSTVQALFTSATINNTINPDEVVALGAAIEADILAGNRKDMLLLDITPLSLGIETVGGLMDVLIPRNTKIPATFKKEYSTSVDGQVNLKIAVYQEVGAEELRSGTKQTVQMKPQYGIEADEIKTMLKESIDHAEEDMSKRSLAEASTEAEQLIYATAKFVSDNASLLTEHNTEKINEL